MQYLPVLAGYIAGSIPFGLLIGFLAGADIRKHGSGNIGATNLLRTCGAKYGIPAFLLDVLKGFLPAFLTYRYFSQDMVIVVLTGIAAILGHNFPVWLRFKGGKGVATSAGALLAIIPAPLGIGLLTFAIVFGASKYVSLGSITASVVMLASHFALSKAPLSKEMLPVTIMAALACLMVIIRHRSNISRLLAGTESKIDFSKKKTSEKADESQKDESGQTTETTDENKEGQDG